MLWPQSQDYNEAIQNAKSCFKDPDLKAGRAVVNALGVPLPCSGNFADVYAVEGANGKGKWAVKCFTRGEPAALRQRYAHIDKHLQQAKLPFTIGFQFLDEGMLIRGKWHPVLKMQWVEGFTLNQFVRDNLDKPAVLDALLKIWVRMGSRLREADLTHADLQHGNVLLVPGSSANALGVKLIDYDGMWVPSLAKQKSGEVGHPAYQHPQRLKEGTYSQDVDRFPLLVVATALRCLRVAGRSLWEMYDNGDNMLFLETDLKSPYDSPVFEDVSKIQDAQAKMLVERLRQACNQALEETPHLGELMGEAPPAKKTTAATDGIRSPAAAELPASGSAFDGLGEDDQVIRTKTKDRPPKKAVEKGNAPSWRKWAIIGGAAAAVLAIVVIAATSGGGGDDDKPVGNSDKVAGTDKKPSDDHVTGADKKPNTELVAGTDKKPSDDKQQPPPPATQLTITELPDLRLDAGSSKEFAIHVKGIQRGTALETQVIKAPDGVTAKLISNDTQTGRAVWKLEASPSAGAGSGVVDVVAHAGEAKGAGSFRLTVEVRDRPPVEVRLPTGGTPEGTARETGRLTTRKPGYSSARLTPDGRRALCEFEGDMFLIDLKTQAQISKVPMGGVTLLEWLPDSRRYVIACTQEPVQVRSDLGKSLVTFERDAVAAWAWALAVSGDGRRAAAITRFPNPFATNDPSVTPKYTLYVWDVLSGKVLHKLGDEPSLTKLLALSADGRWLLAATNVDLLLLDTGTGKVVSRPKGRQARETPNSLALSPDGSIAALAYADADSSVFLWDIQNDREIKKLVGHSYRVHQCKFSSDGRYLLTCSGWAFGEPPDLKGSNDCTARVWEVASGKEVRRMEGHTGPVHSVDLSQDFRTAITASSDRTIRIWDVNLGGPETPAAGGLPALPGLRSYWSLNEGSGDAAIDSVTKKRGKINGSVRWVPGVRGKALQFDGDAHLDLGAGPEGHFDAKAPFTVALWVNSAAEGPAFTLRNQDNGSPVIGLYLGGRLGGKSVRGDVRDNDNESGMHASLTGKTPVTDGQWHHVALVRADDGNVHLFVDGRLETTSDMPQAKGKITTDLRALGADLYCIRKNASQAKFYYQGAIDEFCIFDRALSVDDIRVLARKDQPPTAVVETPMPIPMPAIMPVSAVHAKAREDFASAIAKARADYNAAVVKLVADEKTLLEKKLEDATKAGNTDAALAARDEMTALDREERLLFKESGEAPAPRSGGLVAGTWGIKYLPSRQAYTITIRANGDLVAATREWGKRGRLKPQGGSYVLEPAGERPERYTFVGNRMVIEHYQNAGEFETGTTSQVAVGDLLQAAPAARPNDFISAVARVQTAYNGIVTKTVSDHKARLQALAQEQTKAANLDGALAIKDEIKELEETGPKPLSSGGTAGAAKVVPGEWHVKYLPVRSSYNITIQANGDVFTSSGRTRRGAILLQGNSLVMETALYIERFTFGADRVLIERFRTRPEFQKNVVDQIAIGEMKK